MSVPPARAGLQASHGGESDSYTSSDDDRDKKIKQENQQVATAMIQDVHNFAERERLRKRIKPSRNPYGDVRSRKKKYTSMRHTVRDSRRVYNARTMKALFMKQYMLLPGVRAALEELRAARTLQPVVQEPPEIIVIGGQPLVEWPDGVERITISKNPENIVFPDVGDTDKCGCANDCFRDVCLNASLSFFCKRSNCSLFGRCSNSVYECRDLELINRGDAGFGVLASSTIYVGSILGDYSGVLTTHDFSKNEKETSDYALQLQTRSTRNQKVYIDATSCGGMTRMMNHSCSAACQFVEMRNRSEVKVLVLATRMIHTGEEVTVDYNTPLWFRCSCGSDNCCSLRANLAKRACLGCWRGQAEQVGIRLCTGGVVLALRGVLEGSVDS